jgi:hypothetical protein
MTPRLILAISVRLFTIWLFMYGVSNMTSAYIEVHRSSAHLPDPVVFFGSGISGLVVICTLLWFFPLFIANRLLPPVSPSDTKPALFDDWFAVGCSLIGVWTLAGALSALVRYGLLNYMGKHFWPDSFGINPDWSIIVLTDLFQLFVGLWLLFGARGLRKIVEWARQA